MYVFFASLSVRYLKDRAMDTVTVDTTRLKTVFGSANHGVDTNFITHCLKHSTREGLGLYNVMTFH